MLGSMPRISTTSRSAPGGLATENRVVGHSIRRVIAVDQRDRRPVDLEVVELLRVELGHRLGRPRPAPGARPRRSRRRRRRSTPRRRRATGERSTGRPSNSVTRPSLRARYAAPPAPAAAHRGRTGRRCGRRHASGCRRRRLAWTMPDERASRLPRPRLADRVLVADGAMGTMLQAADPTLDDFQGHEGCNEILNVTRPDVVRGVHDAYLAAGADCVETNTFGANLGQPRRVRHRRPDLRAVRGRRPARPRGRPTAGRTPDRPALRARLGRARAPSCRRSGHAPYATLRDAYQEQRGRPDRRRRRRADRRDLPGPAADQGGGHRRPAGDGRGRPRGAADLPGHRRDHRHDAARLARSARR